MLTQLSKVTLLIIVGVCIALITVKAVDLVKQLHQAEARVQTEVKADEHTVTAAAAHMEQTNTADRTFRRQIERKRAALTAPAAIARIQAQLQADLPASPGSTATLQEIASSELPAEIRAKLPVSSGYVCLSEAQTRAIAADQLSCQADQHSLAARESDVTDLQTQLAARTAEARTWELAAKGGSRWHRLGRVLKLTGCAAGGAAVAALADRSHPSSAAIGASAGVLTCSLF